MLFFLEDVFFAMRFWRKAMAYARFVRKRKSLWKSHAASAVDAESFERRRACAETAKDIPFLFPGE